jgi:hypothetical protein
MCAVTIRTSADDVDWYGGGDGSAELTWQNLMSKLCRTVCSKS